MQISPLSQSKLAVVYISSRQNDTFTIRMLSSTHIAVSLSIHVTTEESAKEFSVINGMVTTGTSNVTLLDMELDIWAVCVKEASSAGGV